MPESFLHYDIEEKLGEGGMGVVYLARDRKLKRKVALKFLPRHFSLNTTEQKRFEQEAQAAALLNHPNIAQVYAIEEEEGEQFIVMEYVEGMNLKEVIRQDKLTIDKKLKISVQIAEGIKAAHEKGIIHRDIKSSNIMINPDGLVKIMDFGLARVLETDHITKTGTTVGTTAYMSPEQLAGHEADERSDIWSYGVVLYELFCGELPFKGKYEQAIIYAITEEDPKPISQISSDIPGRIEHLIHRCLEKNHQMRYQNFSEVLEDLNESKPLKKRKTSTTKAAYLYVGIFTVLVFGALLLFSQFNIPLKAGDIPEKRYLAVLPIENIGGDPGLQAICDGLAETFSYKLSELEKYEDSYWVAPAGELRNEKIKSVTQAKSKFGINLAILSSIQTIADSTRLILELVDADNIRRLDTEQIVVPSQNLALLEQNGVRAMLEMLQIEIDSGMDKAIREGGPSDPEAYEYYLKGRANLQDAAIWDSLGNAIDFFEKAIEIDPEFALAHAGLGESYWRKYETSHDLNFLQKADSSLNRALALNKDLPQVQTLLGILKTGTGKYEEANYHFRRALDIDPKYSPAYSELARAYEEQGETEKAVNTYMHAIELKPDYWAGYNDLGTHYLITGKSEDAIKQFEKVIEITPGNSSVYSNLGIAYHMMDSLEEARRMYETSLALEKNPLTANNLAGIYYDEEMYREAVQMYKIVLESTPDRYDVWGNLALAQSKSGRKKDAEESYGAAIEKAHAKLEVNPSDPEILADLSGYYSDLGDSAKAVEYVSDALEMNAKDIRIRKQAVSVYEKMGMREEALRWVDSSMIADIESQSELADLVADPRYLDWKTRVTTDKQN
jgi:tetratricopeptide (TPR) repeat protein/predicted Ser/Thr protein kinase